MNASRKTVTLPRVITGLAVALLVVLGSPGSSWADSLEIESASISRTGSTLRVRGKDAPDHSTVTVVYPGDGTFIGSVQSDNDGDWSLSVPTPNPAPCRVRAESGNGSDERNVRRAPSNCSNNGGGGGGNNLPDANNDSYSTQQDTALNVSAPGVLGNDTDPDNDPITAVPASGATSAGGSYSLNADGSFTYTPATGFTGNDSFTYTATDGTDTSAPATVSINVTPTGGGGGGVTSRGDDYATPVGTTLNVTASRLSGVLYNDFGGSGPLSGATGEWRRQWFAELQYGRFIYLYTEQQSERQRRRQLHLPRRRDSHGIPVGSHHGQHPGPVEPGRLQDLHELRAGHALHRLRVRLLLRTAALQLHPGTGHQAQHPGPGQQCALPAPAGGRPRAGLDGLGRETVLRDYDHNGNFNKYYLRVLPRCPAAQRGPGPAADQHADQRRGRQFAAVPNTMYDSAAPDGNDALVTGAYNGATGVVLGDDCPDGITVNCTRH